jgi:hypothetical protein
MKIEIDLKELDGSDISEEKKALLLASLGLEETDKLEEYLSKLASAGIIEYVEMLAGKGMPNRADEAKQDRLLYMIKKVFSPFLPGDDEIAVMFQLTSTQAKTLLRNTLSRYRTKLSEELKNTLEEHFKSASQDKNGWVLTIPSDIFVEQYNLIIAREGAEFNPVRKRSEGTRKYFISNDTYSVLRDHFGN